MGISSQEKKREDIFDPKIKGYLDGGITNRNENSDEEEDVEAGGPL